MPPASDELSIADLLRLGLDHYGRGEEARAFECWREVLRRDPDDPVARDYLEAAGADPVADNVVDLNARRSARAAAASTVPRELEAKIVEAVQSKRYDDALRMLYAAKRTYPADLSVSRSIQHLKAKITQLTLRELGTLERVPRPDELRPGADPESTLVAGLVDGVASLDDILEASPLGRHRTLLVLARLLPPAAPEESFDELFERAMQAYLRGDRALARELFLRCRELRPDDVRVRHNLAKLGAP